MPGRIGRRTFLMTAASGLTVLAVPGMLRPRSWAWAESSDGQGIARVLIRRGDSSVDAPAITVSGDGEVAVADGNNELIFKAGARQKVTVGREGDAFWVEAGDNRRTGLTGPIRFNGTGDGAPLRNQSTSTGDPTPYRGTLEVTASPDNQVALVNVLGLEEYLYGVVTKELPALFGAEPLKAQAVAARTYTLSRRDQAPHKSQSADVCDTQHCQAFGGFAGEHAAGRAAVDATRGKVLYIAGALFQPLYASACGGHTETAGRIYGGGDDGGTNAVPDGEIPNIALGSDEGALEFYKKSWDSYCSGSDRYRWSYSWEPEQLKGIVAAGIQRFRGTQTVTSSESDERVEQLENVVVSERGPSGRALTVRFEAPGVSWSVKRDWGIRNFLRTPDGNLLPSSAVAFEVERDVEQKLTKLTAYGAGWGHGAGLCQWGTKGLANRGFSYEEILGHYYPSAEIGEADTGSHAPLPATVPVTKSDLPPPAAPTPISIPTPAPTPKPAPPNLIPPPRTAPNTAPAAAPPANQPSALPGLNSPLFFPGNAGR